MGIYLIGKTITLQAEFVNKRTGSPVEPDTGTISCKVYKDSSLIHTADPAKIVSDGDGAYHYNWDTEDTLDEGKYIYIWEAKYQDQDVGNDGVLTLRKRKGL